MRIGGRRLRRWSDGRFLSLGRAKSQGRGEPRRAEEPAGGEAVSAHAGCRPRDASAAMDASDPAQRSPPVGIRALRVGQMALASPRCAPVWARVPGLHGALPPARALLSGPALLPGDGGGVPLLAGGDRRSGRPGPLRWRRGRRGALRQGRGAGGQGRGARGQGRGARGQGGSPLRKGRGPGRQVGGAGRGEPWAAGRGRPGRRPHHRVRVGARLHRLDVQPARHGAARAGPSCDGPRLADQGRRLRGRGGPVPGGLRARREAAAPTLPLQARALPPHPAGPHVRRSSAARWTGPTAGRRWRTAARAW